MGEDIHFKAVFADSQGRRFDAREICDWGRPDFRPFFEGRNYDVFSLFGSARGHYPELPYGNYGMPDFMKGTPFDEWCRESGYYGFVWWRLPDAEKAAAEYLDRLKDPLKWYSGPEGDEDELAAWKSRLDAACALGPAEVAAVFDEWRGEHAHVLSALERMRDVMREDYRREQALDGLVLDETVFILFFDS